MEAGFLRSVPERLFALDTRSLALFRAGLGLTVVADAAGRFPDLVVHYSDAGAVPRALVHELLSGPPLSVHMANGSAWFAGALLALHLVAGLCLLTGYKTRLATAVAWALTLSVHHRNPLVVNYGDLILRMLLLWSLFLPLAARASFDRLHANAPPAPQRFLGLGTLGFVVQLACIYFFSALLKTGADWQDGSAVAHALQHDHFAKQPQALFALGYPQVLAVLTHATRSLEFFGPLLLFVPFAMGVTRTALVCAFAGFHLGLFAFMELGFFPWVCVAAWCALLPSAFWDRVRVPGAAGPAIERRWQWPALIFLVLVLASNLGTLKAEPSIPDAIRKPLRFSGLYQKWTMFAPSPARVDGWLVVVGSLADGREVDLLHGGDVRWDKPAEISAGFPRNRWRVYTRSLWRRRPEVRSAYAAWLCRNENASRSVAARVERVAITFMKEDLPPPGGVAPVERVDFLETPCPK